MFKFLLVYLAIVSYPLKILAQKVPIEPVNKYQDIAVRIELNDIPLVPKGEFKYGGAGYFSALIKGGFVSKIQEKYPEFKVIYQEPDLLSPGSASAIQMLLEKKIDFAHLDRPLSRDELLAAKSQNIELESIPIAFEGISFFVNLENQDKSLTLKQLKDILTGKITNWAEVGGSDMPISIVSLESELDSLLLSDFLISSFSENWTITRDITTAIRKVSSTPGALGFGSAGIIKEQKTISPINVALDEDSPAISSILQDGNVNYSAIANKYYPVTRKLYLVIRRDEKSEIGVAYANLLLSQPMQEIFKKAGLVSIYLPIKYPE